MELMNEVVVAPSHVYVNTINPPPGELPALIGSKQNTLRVTILFLYRLCGH